MSIDHRLLMRYHDGELDPEERAELERSLSGDPEAAAVLAAFGRIGDEIRTHQRARYRCDVDLTERVMRRVAEASPARSRARPAAFVGLALAAALALWFSTRAGGPDAPPKAALVPVPSGAEQVLRTGSGEPEPASADSGPVVAIENVEFGEGTGTIFVVAGAGHETPVVWVSDDLGGSSGMERL